MTNLVTILYQQMAKIGNPLDQSPSPQHFSIENNYTIIMQDFRLYIGIKSIFGSFGIMIISHTCGIPIS